MDFAKIVQEQIHTLFHFDLYLPWLYQHQAYVRRKIYEQLVDPNIDIQPPLYYNELYLH
jgi:hypothetical protein